MFECIGFYYNRYTINSGQSLLYDSILVSVLFFKKVKSNKTTRQKYQVVGCGGI